MTLKLDKKSLVLNIFLPIGSTQRDAGDFAAVLYTVVKDRAYEGEKVTIDELNTRYCYVPVAS